MFNGFDAYTIKHIGDIKKEQINLRDLVNKKGIKVDCHILKNLDLQLSGVWYQIIAYTHKAVSDFEIGFEHYKAHEDKLNKLIDDYYCYTKMWKKYTKEEWRYKKYCC